MNALLFPEAAKPIVKRWISPGDLPKKHNHRPRAANYAPREKKAPKDNRRPNPFRQPIGDPDELDFRHMKWSRIRGQVRQALKDTCCSTTALDRFDNCGAETLVEWSDTAQRYRLRGSYCHSRHCQPCAKARASLIAMNLKAKLEAGAQKDGDRFRFITLTLRHSAKPLAEQLEALRSHFRKLRSSPLWKGSQRGGAVMIECHLNDRDEWHPHLHIVAEGDWISQAQLANYWMELTNGSFKVDVRKIAGPKDVAFYVAKYVTKGTKDDVWDNPQRAREWVSATHGMRSCATFGTWRGFGLTHHDPATEHKDWKPIALLSRMCSNARAGSIADLNMLHILADAVQYDPSRRRQKRDTTPGST